MNKRKILLAMVILAAALCTASFLFVRYAPALGDNYVAKIGSHKVSFAEFCVYLRDKKLSFEKLGGSEIWEIDFDGATSADVAKQSALNSVAHVKITKDQADRRGIILTTEEKASARERAAETFKSYSPEFIAYSEITQELLEKIVQETTLYSKVQEEITKYYEISEGAFQSYYTETYLMGGEASAEGEDLDSLREKYLKMKKQEYFFGEYEKWSKNVQIIKNQSVWEQLSVEDIN